MHDQPRIADLGTGWTWLAGSANSMSKMAHSTGTSNPIKLDRRTRARLKALGQARQRSEDWLLKEAIARYLEEEEDLERIKRETLERWERYEATGEYITNGAMKAWLKSWGGEDDDQCPTAGD
jgi:predicted transcriptional regulator